MKKIFLLGFLLGTFAFFSCGDDDAAHDDDTPDYFITINAPTTDDKFVGDSIHIHVDFEDHHETTVHHAKVRIYNKATGEEIYNKPDDAHVHEMTGKYAHHDDVILNVEEHTDWILEAKVWGHEEGAHEVTETIEFHVHPQ